MTERTQQGFAFEEHFSRRVAAEFSGNRLSSETLRANQLRLYFSSLAYVLLHALRRIGLVGTEWAQAGTIRLRLLKIAAQVRVTARRIRVCYSNACPWKSLFSAACSALRC
jgi:Transposase DDE domain group 1